MKAELFGVRVAWSAAVGDSPDPVAHLLRALEPPARGEADARAANLVVEVRADAAVDRAPIPAGYRASFFHGQMRASERGGEFLLVAPGSRVTIARDGSRIDAQVDPARMEATSFADTTLFVALCIALRRHGLFHMHAGAVARGDGARVLVIGDSGAGKSTVTLSLLDARARHLGDDALFLTRREGRACLLGFPRPFHLGPATLAAFPALAESLQLRAHRDKRAVPLASLPGAAMDRMESPDVVLFPEVTPFATTVCLPMSPADAFGHALRSSALLVVDGMGDAGAQLAILGELLAHARAFELRLGADWLSDPHAAVARLPWR